MSVQPIPVWTVPRVTIWWMDTHAAVYQDMQERTVELVNLFSYFEIFHLFRLNINMNQMSKKNYHIISYLSRLSNIG